MPNSLYKRIRTSTFAAFQNIVDDAISLKVNFVLISEDIYDRRQRMLALLEKITERNQVIYFTADDRIKDFDGEILDF